MANSHPRIKSHYSMIAHSADEIEFRSGVWDPRSFLLEDQLQQGKLLSVLQFIDGKHSCQHIAEKTDLPVDVIDQVVTKLGEVNIVEHAPSNGLDYFLEEQLRRSKPATATPSVSKVTLIGDETLCYGVSRQLQALEQQYPLQIIVESESLHESLIGSDWLHHSLQFEEQLQQFQHWQNNFVVYLTASPNPHLAFKLNKLLFALKCSWLFAVIDGPFLFVGPTFAASKAPCYECLEKRLSMNVRDSKSYQKYKNAIAFDKVIKKSEMPINGTVQQLLISHTALEAINFILAGKNFTDGRLLSIYLPTMEIEFHGVEPYHNCSTCVDSESKRQQELYFEFGELMEQTHETEH